MADVSTIGVPTPMVQWWNERMWSTEPCPECNSYDTHFTNAGPGRVYVICWRCRWQGPEGETPTAALELWNDLPREVRSEGEMYELTTWHHWMHLSNNGSHCLVCQSGWAGDNPPPGPCREDTRMEREVSEANARVEGDHVHTWQAWAPDGRDGRSRACITCGETWTASTDQVTKLVNLTIDDQVTSPIDSHYTRLGGLQPRDAIASWSLTWTGPTAFALGNIVKLAARYFTKNTPRYNLQGLKFYVGELERVLGEEEARQAAKKEDRS